MSDETETQAAPEAGTAFKRKPGRPRKNLRPAPALGPVAAQPKPVKPKEAWVTKSAPNWETNDMDSETGVDRYHIPPEMIPEGMSLQWVTNTVFGEPQRQHRASFEKRGWTPVHPQDGDGRFDGWFTPKGYEGEIELGGQVLMIRPVEITEKAKRLERRAAAEQVQIKEQALRGGDLPGVAFDTRRSDGTNVNTGAIKKSWETIHIPGDD